MNQFLFSTLALSFLVVGQLHAFAEDQPSQGGGSAGSASASPATPATDPNSPAGLSNPPPPIAEKPVFPDTTRIDFSKFAGDGVSRGKGDRKYSLHLNPPGSPEILSGTLDAYGYAEEGSRAQNVQVRLHLLGGPGFKAGDYYWLLVEKVDPKSPDPVTIGLGIYGLIKESSRDSELLFAKMNPTTSPFDGSTREMALELLRVVRRGQRIGYGVNHYQSVTADSEGRYLEPSMGTGGMTGLDFFTLQTGE